MSIFPFIDPEEYIKEEDLKIKNSISLAREWAWDFEKEDFLLKNGKMYMVEKNEAIKIWIWKILATPRYRHLIYDHDYGTELDTLIGLTMSKVLAKSEAERMIKEAIMVILDDYIEKIYDFSIEIEGDSVNVKFTIDTIYDQEVEVNGLKYRIG